MNTNTYDTIVIGAGQAGLAAAYHLKRSGRSFLIVDAADRVGSSWQDRWDSLRLFTPATYDSLPGTKCPGGHGFPTKDELLDYFEQYVARFDLQVRLRTPVDGLFRDGDLFQVTSDRESFTAANVIVATGAHRSPKQPAFADELAPEIRQLHSADYRNPGQLQPGTVLIVGAGNSGAEIAVELGPSHPVLLSGRNVGYLPIDIRGWQGRLGMPVIWWMWEHILTTEKKAGRKAQAQVLEGHGDVLIRLKEKDLVAAGIERVARITGIVGGRPTTEDGVVLDVANVIWCTGFKPDLAWIDLPGLDTSGRLESRRGEVIGQPGLYVLGQEYDYKYNSFTVGGVGGIAEHVVKRLPLPGSPSPRSEVQSQALE
jgi:putative flavoprotein involved in K+ transport